MARYSIIYWNDIPSQVAVVDAAGKAKAMLPPRFQEAIDAAAMAEGSTSSDAYLAGWITGPPQQRDGSAQAVLDTVLSELDSAFPQDRLRELVRAHRRVRAGK